MVSSGRWCDLRATRTRRVGVGMIMSARDKVQARPEAGSVLGSRLPLQNFFWPRALDEREDGSNLFVGQAIAESGHIRCMATRVGRRPPLGNVEENLIGMVPRMTRDVMGRRRQLAVSQPHPPIRLPFEISAMTASALSSVDSPPHVDLPGVGMIDDRRYLRRDGDEGPCGA